MVTLNNAFKASNIQFSTPDKSKGILDDFAVRKVIHASEIYTGDHLTASEAMVINVCYGTSDPPAASTTTEGTIFIVYTP